MTAGKNEECKLMNERGAIVAMGSRDQMTRFLKHHVEDSNSRSYENQVERKRKAGNAS
jgi:hypothetical protein